MDKTNQPKHKPSRINYSAERLGEWGGGEGNLAAPLPIFRTERLTKMLKSAVKSSCEDESEALMNTYKFFKRSGLRSRTVQVLKCLFLFWWFGD